MKELENLEEQEMQTRRQLELQEMQTRRQLELQTRGQLELQAMRIKQRRERILLYQELAIADAEETVLEQLESEIKDECESQISFRSGRKSIKTKDNFAVKSDIAAAGSWDWR